MKYRIVWRNKITGFTGHGEPLDKATAEAWVERLNKEWPQLHHWVEPVR